MDQISRPVLVALIAVVVFAAAWMTVLKPKTAADPESDAVAAPIAASVDQAQGAVATSAQANAAVEGATNDPAPAAAAKPAAAKPKPKPVAKAAPAAAAPKAAKAGRTILLFAGRGADDAVARQVVARSSRPGVKVIVAAVDDVADYASLLGGAKVAASPTIFVIGADRKAVRIEGLPDAAQVDQALRTVR